MITFTPEALTHARAMLEKRGTPAAFIRLGVKTAGCSGLSYLMEYADTANPEDEHLPQEGGLTVLVDAKSLIYLAGTTVDYQFDALKSGFVFTNPNQKGACGCGESFTV